jgi:hypothetical protein
MTQESHMIRQITLLGGLALALAATACSPLQVADSRTCLGALIASPAADVKSLLATAQLTPACYALAADVLQAALTQALAAKGR